MMNGATLEGLRRMLFFSTSEAGILLGETDEYPDGVSEETWMAWESGASPIPEEVQRRIQALAEWREERFQAYAWEFEKMQGSGESNEVIAIALVWYPTLESWLTLARREAIEWRPMCSVMASLAARYEAVLVNFDPTHYKRWLGKRKDTEQTRANWAAVFLVEQDSARLQLGQLH